ncbi:hypothetical protein JOE11_004503 [Robbsia andropogonis]|uniref:hypothetical protein n=1 Tax=Robbsia andropogonis TaxID=28092 RepID=UPI003D210BB5
MTSSPTLIRLAKLIKDNSNATEIIDLVKSLVLAGTASATRRPATVEDATPDAIGCWQRVPNNPQRFERVKDPHGVWRTWADVDRIEPDPSARRVIFVGESAGRGFLYDPYLTPAGLLQKHFDTATNTPVQVVDLARTNMSFTESVAVSRKAAALFQPDALVLFVGNNWLSAGDIFQYVDLVALSSALRIDGFAAFVAQLESALDTLASRLVATLSEIRTSSGTKVVLIIPEFNLRDWKPGFENAPPFLSGENLAAWEARRIQAEAALDAEDHNRVVALADEMIALDNGFAPHSLWLKGQGVLHASGAAKARIWLEKARDMAAILPVPQAPGVHSRAITAMRRLAYDVGIGIVDLPQCFAEADGSSLPDRKYFLDYCHLTEKGIDTLAHHAARAVADAWHDGKSTSTPTATWKPVHALSARARASAMFLAAIHNANWGQSGNIVRHWVDLAIDTAPDDARRWFQCFLKFETSLQPRWTHSAFDELDIAQIERYMGFKLNPHLADHELKRAMVDALRRHGDTDALDTWHALLFDVYLQPGSAQNLLQPQHAARHHAALRPFHENPAYLQSVSATTEFFFVADGGRDGVLRSVVRTPRGLAGPGRCTVNVNGSETATIDVASTWTRGNTTIPAHALKPGVNRLSLHWPAPSRVDDTLIDRAARNLSLQRGPEVFHVYGQVHQLTLRSVDSAA